MAPAFKGMDFSLLMWSLARLGMVNERELMQRLMTLAIPVVPAFSTQALANCAWACEQLDHRDMPFLQALSSAMQACLAQRLKLREQQQQPQHTRPGAGSGAGHKAAVRQVSPQDISLFVVSLAHLQAADRQLLDATAQYCLQQPLETWPSMSRVQLLSAFAAARRRNPQLLLAVAQAQECVGWRLGVPSAAASNSPAPTLDLGSEGWAVEPSVHATSAAAATVPDLATPAAAALAPARHAAVQHGMTGPFPAVLPDSNRAQRETAIREAAMFVWCMARLSGPQPHPEVQRAAQSAAAALVGHRADVELGSAAMTAWGLCRLGLPTYRILQLACLLLRDRLEGGASSRPPWSQQDLDSLVMVVWTMGRSQQLDQQLLEALARSAPQLLPRLTTRQLAMVCRSHVELKYNSPALLQVAAQQVAAALAGGRLSLRCLAALMWALASGGQAGRSLMQQAAAKLEKLLQASRGVSTAGRPAVLLLWAYAAADCYSPMLFDMLLDAVVSGGRRLVAEHAVMALWACAVAGHHSPAALRALCVPLQAQLGTLSPAAAAQACWALAHLAAPLYGLWRGPDATLVQCLAPQCRPKQLLIMLWSMAQAAPTGRASTPRAQADEYHRASAIQAALAHASRLTPAQLAADGGASGSLLIWAEALALLLASPAPALRAMAKLHIRELRRQPAPVSLDEEEEEELAHWFDLSGVRSNAEEDQAGPLAEVSEPQLQPSEQGMLYYSLVRVWAKAQRKAHPMQAAVASAAKRLGLQPRRLRTSWDFPVGAAHSVVLPDLRAVLLLTDPSDFASNVAGQPLGPLAGLVCLLKARRWRVAIVYADHFKELRWPSRQGRYLRMLLKAAGAGEASGPAMAARGMRKAAGSMAARGSTLGLPRGGGPADAIVP